MTNTHLHDYKETSRSWLEPQRKGQRWREMIAYECKVKGCPKPHKVIKGSRTLRYRPPD